MTPPPRTTHRDLATRLVHRLVAHVLRPANAAAFDRLVDAVRAEAGPPPDDLDPGRYVEATRGCVTDLLVHEGSPAPDGPWAGPPGPSLVRRLLGEPGADDGAAPDGLDVDDAERALLAGWRSGGVHGFFLVTDVVDEHAVLHNLEDDLDYPVWTGRSQVPASALAPDLPLAARVLPVGAGWIFAGTPDIYPPDDLANVVEGVVGLLAASPCPAYRNPARLARARELVADHHRAFLDLFGDVVVEGTATHVIDAYLRFQERIGAPADEFALLPSLRDVRRLPDDGTDPDDAAFALAHHPVKGLRLLDCYAQLREVHTPPLAPWKPPRLAQVLADPDVPSWVLVLLAERYADHLDALYGAALDRPGLAWARDGAALLRDREPAATRDEPGLMMTSSIMGRVLPPGDEPADALSRR